jgi:hypothetical protein
MRMPPAACTKPPQAVPLPIAAFTILHGVFNAISVKLLGFLSLLSVGFHVVGTIVIVIGELEAAELSS